jgi:ABC-type nitrate/sulfonate/bicarbonate transport system substrate-binding protein
MRVVRLLSAALKRTVLFTALLLMACVHSVADEQTSKLVRLSYSSGWDALPALVAMERGFFEQEKLVVSGMPTSSAGALVNSLAAGTTDAAAVPQRTLLIMAAAEVPVTIVAVGSWGLQFELIARAGSGITSVETLKGKTIAISAGSDALGPFMRLINQAGLRPDAVKVIQVSAGQLMSAIKEKAADAVFESVHFTRAIVERGDAELILGPDDVTNAIGSVMASPLVLSKTLVSKQPDVAQRVVNAWVKALRYIQQDPEDAARLMRIFFDRQGVRVTAEVAQQWVEAYNYNLDSWTEAAIADANYNGWGLNAARILKVVPDISGMVDNRFAERAVERLGQKSEDGTEGGAEATAGDAASADRALDVPADGSSTAPDDEPTEPATQ